MGKYASEVVKQAVAWLGLNESAGTHKQIIDIYNSHKPHPRGYKVKYTDEWCATTVSAVAIKLGYTNIIPVECGCEKMVALFKKLGCWIEDESATPKPGWVLFYHWKDNGKGDCTGRANHVGIVEKVSNGKVTIIEGNYKNAVTRRTLSVNSKYMRGYGVPKYDAEPTTNTSQNNTTTTKEEKTVNIELKVLKKGAKNNQVKALQRMLYALGYDLGTNPIDGNFGTKTDAAIRAYQSANKLTADGIVGEKTWTKLLKG